MKLSYITPISIGILISISGCQLQERGMTLPPPKVKPRPQPKTTDYEFPLLTLKASNTNTSSDEETEIPAETIQEQKVSDSLPSPTKQKSQNETSSKKSQEAIVKEEEESNSLFGSLATQVTGIFKPSKQANTKDRVKSRTVKKSERIITEKANKPKETKPRRRKFGKANKLIFNKNTSFRDIPIPLPKLSSLKLKSLRKAIPSIPVSKIPILNALIPEGSKISKRRLKQKNASHFERPATRNSDTQQNTNSLDMANIRIGKSNDYTTLIFDSYKWGGYNRESTKEAPDSGKYTFSYEPDNNRIVAVIEGYNAFSALLGDQSELFKDSDVIKNIYIDRYIGENSIKFIISLRKKVRLNVLDVKNPGRIIVNLYPQ